MRWPIALLFLVGCAPTSQERLKELTTDGVHLYRQGAYVPARETFRAALELRPNDPDLLYNLGRCHEKMGDHAAADEAYQRCLQVAPDHPEVRHAIVARLVATGRRDEAVRQVHNWLRGSPKLAAPYVEDGWLYAGERQFEPAGQRYLQALTIDPRNPRALVELATIFEKMDKRPEALALYRHSLDVNPDQPAVRQRVKDLQASGVGLPHPEN